MTQSAFFKALVDKFDANELCELLEIETEELVWILSDMILENQAVLEDELKWGH
jgi:hypothetical protein